MSEINNFLGWSPDEGSDSVEDFQKFFATKFIARDKVSNDPDLISKMEGRRIGSINTTVNRLFGEVIGMNADELRTSKVEDVLGTIKETYEGQIDEIKSRSKDGNDKKVNDLQALIEDKDKSIDAYKQSIQKLETDFGSFKLNSQDEISNYMTNHQLSEVYGSLNYKEGISEVEKAGFKALVSNSVKLGLDENKKLIVRDSDGNPIPSKKSASEHATPADVLSELAEKNNLLRKNNAKVNTDSKSVVQSNGKSTERKLQQSYYDRIAAVSK